MDIYEFFDRDKVKKCVEDKVNKFLDDTDNTVARMKRDGSFAVDYYRDNVTGELYDTFDEAKAAYMKRMLTDNGEGSFFNMYLEPMIFEDVKELICQADDEDEEYYYHRDDVRDVIETLMCEYATIADDYFKSRGYEV